MREKFQRIFGLYNTPDISQQLSDLIEQRESVNGLLITIFDGGPLDLKHFGIEDAWLYPFEVKSSPGRYSLLNFDVLRVGNRPDGSVLVDLTPDDYYKLGLKDPKKLFDNNRLVIRVNPNQFISEKELWVVFQYGMF